MRFTEPAFLLLAIPLGGLLVASWRYVYGMSRGRKAVAFGVRAVLLSLIVLALAGPQAHRPPVGTAVVFLLDFSESIADSDRELARRFVEEAMGRLGPDDQASVVVFGRDARVEIAPGSRGRLNQILSVVDGSATDLSNAVRLASALLPEGKARRVMILSDGNETDGDLADAADAAATAGIEIDYRLLGTTPREGEVLVRELQTPHEVSLGQTFDLRAVVESSVTQESIMTLDREGTLVDRQQVRLSEGLNSILFSDVLNSPGFFRYRLTLSAPLDSDPRNNVGMGFVAARGRPRLLVLQQTSTVGPLVAALRSQGLDVELGDPVQMPVSTEGLQRYDAVVFNDLHASLTSVAQQRLLRNAIRDTGLGFAMIGGENSFLPGGYYGSPLAEALPVDLDVRQRKSFPSTSILIMVDSSGSMGMVEDGFPKIRLAAMAAEETVKLLGPQDRIGVVASDSSIAYVAPMQEVGDRVSVISQIRRLTTGGGGIYAQPSFEFIQRELPKEPSRVRHVILLADGADVETYGRSLDIIRELRRENITVTAVAIGDGKDVPFLKEVARVGGGNFYLANRAGQLPAIFTQDTALMSRSAIEEGEFLPRPLAGEEILRGITPSSLPPLLAYCLTDARPLARVGMLTEKDDPLLAVWQFGLGTTLAFTSDALPRWATHWVEWEGFATFWAQAMRAITRQTTRHDYQVVVRQEGGEGVVEILAFDAVGKPLDNLDGVVRVGTPSGESIALPMLQEAPGRFVGRLRTSEIGTYTVTVAEIEGGEAVGVRASGFSIAYPPEYRTFRPNPEPLARAAASTGGQEVTSVDQVWRPATRALPSVRDLWPSFVLWAAILLPLDIGIRRVAVPVSAILAWFFRRRPAGETPPEETALGRLQAARARAGAQPNPEPDRSDRARPKVSLARSDRIPHEGSPKRHVSSGKSTASRLLEAKRRRDFRD